MSFVCYFFATSFLWFNFNNVCLYDAEVKDGLIIANRDIKEGELILVRF